ncbi:CRISPR-associated protein Cas5, Hmari subtype [Halorhabdus utahensis DSM 12940]|uniref:CRISPR-associated protein Cas5, Hmari subtype n=1 Tax=Halorhabdus utahensis (strain DSM 12940 / JCM 11049 / AX-2) TaxID=519442 RepID=C7NNV3_HALUD|nr:type I-B CRISPR-associated protein Cas5b [Halorhabdus utahensis]ACV11628.1 CRISPR-associated protein Cas5, Hmari subtype [Halorhabdus utahensis DSM 12940]
MDQESSNGRTGTDGSDLDRCLSFEIRGPWGHFRRVEGNVVKQTYRIVPRTTVAGLIAAVLGIDRDGYYDLFGPEVSAIAIQPVEELRTVNMPMNTLSTAAGDLTSLNPRGKISIKLPNPTKLRQQHNYEVLVDPAYRIDVALADDERYEQLRETLAAGKSHYVPSLGLSEYLAEIDYLGEFDVKPGPASGTIAVDSAVPDAMDDVVLDPETRCQIEQSPAFMASDGSGRTTTEYTTYTYNPDAEPLQVRDVPTSRVDDRTVVFV